MRFKVIYQLMVDPTQGDHTFNKSYIVEAESEKEALAKAEEAKDDVYDNKWGHLKYRSVFSYDIEKID